MLTGAELGRVLPFLSISRWVRSTKLSAAMSSVFHDVVALLYLFIIQEYVAKMAFSGKHGSFGQRQIVKQ